MRKVVLFMHMSLDGFTARTNGGMEWISVEEEMFEAAGQRTREADTALYGRRTYELMQSYWPTAADQPNATKHDIEHSMWYKQV
ncbi:MAG TPA: dihydrofolate reductase family protein, partial [Prolixibacteraceae bacterium]